MHDRDQQPQPTSRRGNAEWRELFDTYRLKTRYVSPVVLERGDGLRLWDVEGKEYLDFHSGQVCAGIGHANPDLAEALARQLRTLVQTGSIFTTPAEVEVARLLAELAGPPFAKSVFACSGSEAARVPREVRVHGSLHARLWPPVAQAGGGRDLRKARRADHRVPVQLGGH